MLAQLFLLNMYTIRSRNPMRYGAKEYYNYVQREAK